MILQGNIWNAYSASDHTCLLHSTRVVSPENESNVEGERRRQHKKVFQLVCGTN